MCEIFAVENFCSRTLGQCSPVSLKTCYACHCAKFYRVRPNGVTIIFTPFTILASQGESFGHSSPVWAVMYSKPPLCQSPRFRPLLATRVRDIYCQSSSVLLTTWPTKSSKRQVFAYHAATLIFVGNGGGACHSAS